MKIFAGIICALIGFTIFLGSLGGVLSGEIFWGLFTMSISFVLFYAAFSLFKNKPTNQNRGKTTYGKTSKESQRVQAIRESKNQFHYNIEIKELERYILMSIESFDIIGKSKRVENVEDRLIELRNYLGIISREKETGYFVNVLNKAYNKYTELYYDRKIPEEVKSILLNPENILSDDNWWAFVNAVLIKTLQRYVHYQLFDLNELKTERGRKNRVKRTMEKYDEFCYHHPYLRNHIEMIDLEKTLKWRYDNP